jgi:hypothetical protein
MDRDLENTGPHRGSGSLGRSPVIRIVLIVAAALVLLFVLSVAAAALYVS